MKKFKYIIFLLALLSSGCQPMLRLIYGVKNPDFQSKGKIMEFQSEIGLEYEPYLSLNAENWIGVKGRSFPDLYVFDREGRFIDYHDSLKPNCNGPAEQFLSELDPQKIYYYSEKYSLSSLNLLLEDPDCNSTRIVKSDSSDFIIILSYATFLGKRIHYEKTVLWRNALINNQNIKYQLFYLNEDLKECWNSEQRKLFERKE